MILCIILESTTETVDEYPEISGITNAREAMKKMPEEDRAKIAQQVGNKFCTSVFASRNRS